MVTLSHRDTKKQFWLLLFLTSFILSGLDIILPSLPAIGEHFAASVSLMQWNISGFLIGFGFAQLIFGPLSDIFGRRKIMIAGICMAIAGNILCIFAINIYVLIFFRVVTGAGCCVGLVLARAMARDLFTGVELSKFQSWITLVWGTTVALAPIIGGYIQKASNWRCQFIFLTIYSIFALLLVKKYLIETTTKTQQSFKGILSLYKQVLKNKTFIIYALLMLVVNTALMTYFAIAPFIFINYYGLSVAHFGYLGIAVAVPIVLGATINANYLSSWNKSIIIAIGGGVMLLAGLNALHAHSADYITLYHLVIYIFEFIIGIAIILPNTTSGSLSAVPKAFGTASAVFGAFQMMGGGILTALLTMCFPSTIETLAFLFLGFAVSVLILALYLKLFKLT
jgi:MFS transporter, DHA1 family, multidrug resistance protein